MIYVDHTKPPFIDISLPPAIILPDYKLIVLYSCVLLIDFGLLRYEHSFHFFMSGKQLRIMMAIYHIIIPMIYISSHPSLNILYAAAPWFFATYSVHMPIEHLTFKNWYHSILAIIVEEKDQQYTPLKIRMKGASNIALGIFKLIFCHLIINPVLPRHPEYALEYFWLHPYSLMYTILFGVKGYCYLGAVDIFMGSEQMLFGWNMVNLFDYPILSSSPRDFWSRRWNKVIRNLLHDKIFINYKNKSEKLLNDSKKQLHKTSNIKKTAISTKTIRPELNDSTDTNSNHDIMPVTRKSFWSSRRGAGLLSFIVSGTFHELIIMSACRKITLEHLIFFTLQGVLCMIEVEIRQGMLKQEPTGKMRVACIAFHLFLMSVFGRLFTGPLLRYDFFS